MTAHHWQLAQQILTPKQLRVLELRERHGFSLDQIAYATGRSRDTVRTHLRAAEHNLGRALREDHDGQPATP